MDERLKVFGYEAGGSKLLKMGEVTIQTSPSRLRELAQFLIVCAEGMEGNPHWDHEHWSDFAKGEKFEGPEIVVAS